jgi:hypothetical protein
MNRLMQGVVAAIAPDQAETPSSAGLNQLIRDLRDEFDLDIAPRESNYSWERCFRPHPIPLLHRQTRPGPKHS